MNECDCPFVGNCWTIVNSQATVIRSLEVTSHQTQTLRSDLHRKERKCSHLYLDWLILSDSTDTDDSRTCDERSPDATFLACFPLLLVFISLTSKVTLDIKSVVSYLSTHPVCQYKIQFFIFILGGYGHIGKWIQENNFHEIFFFFF